MFKMHRVNSHICVIKKSRSGVFVEAGGNKTISRSGSTEELLFEMEGVSGHAPAQAPSVEIERWMRIEDSCPREKLRDIYRRRKEVNMYHRRIRPAHHLHEAENHHRVIGFDVCTEYSM